MYFILLTNMRPLRLVVTPQLRKTSEWSFFASLKISYSKIVILSRQAKKIRHKQKTQ